MVGVPPPRSIGKQSFFSQQRDRLTARTAGEGLGEERERRPRRPITASRSPCRRPGPTTRAELVQAHDDRDAFQAAPDELPVTDIHSV